ncbi:MAG: PrsW family glutamic-type intramembrane protease [Lachnospiraceae bacterium]|nr:PrsW family glutamic-type intramembrane protease [Lachnospiraceae bacterium]
MAGQNRGFFTKAKSGDISIGDIFTDVFRSHTKEENGRLFAAGTSLATPAESDMLAVWVKPYMFLRIFLVGLLIFLIGYIMGYYVGSVFFYPITFTVGAFLVPVTVMFFFWEMNIPRNMTFGSVIIILLLGGMLSLIITTILNNLNTAETDFFLYIGVGIIEELAKVLAACLFLKGKDKKYILTGMLVGSAVGAGFASMETATYSIFLTGGWSFENLMLRAVLAIGGHVTWAAFTCGGLVWAKGGEELAPKHFVSPKFLGCYAIAAGLHAAWDLSPYMWLYVVLCIAIVVLCFLMIRVGLQQVVQTSLLLNGGSYTRALKDGGTAGTVGGNRAVDSQVRLQGMNGVYANRRFALRETLHFGRAPQNEISFPADTPGVSARHCEIMSRNGRIYIRDLNSTYGTYVNGKRIAPDTVVELAAGNIVSVGPGKELFRVDIK